MEKKDGIGFFEKYLTVWVALCIITGIAVAISLFELQSGAMKKALITSVCAAATLCGTAMAQGQAFEEVPAPKSHNSNPSRRPRSG